MAISVVPALIDALVTTARANVPAGVNVFDGFGVSDDDPGSFLKVGVDDAGRADAAVAATSAQAWAHANTTEREELGEIQLVASAWNGDADQKAARDAAYAIAESLAAALRANPSLGLPTLLWTSFGTQFELHQDQTDGGAVAEVRFQVHFEARI